MTWHADAVIVGRYVRGDLDEAHSLSLEAHLLACESCRALIAAGADRGRLEAVWAEIEELVDAPAATPVERLLTRLGVSDHVARLLAATPSLTVSWLAAVATALAFAVLAAHESERGLLLFLALAPLLPLAGVAAAYGPGVDPTYEVGLASPMQSFRLLLVRAAAVMTTTSVLAAAAALALPGFGWTVAAWLLPAFGLTLASLALATVLAPLAAAGGVAFLWIAAVLMTATVSGDRLLAFRTGGQAAFLAVTLVAGLVVLGRRDAFETEGRS